MLKGFIEINIIFDDNEFVITAISKINNKFAKVIAIEISKTNNEFTKVFAIAISKIAINYDEDEITTISKTAINFDKDEVATISKIIIDFDKNEFAFVIAISKKNDVDNFNRSINYKLMYFLSYLFENVLSRTSLLSNNFSLFDYQLSIQSFKFDVNESFFE